MFGDVYVCAPRPDRGLPDPARSLGRSVSIAVLAAVLLASAGTVYATAGATKSWYPDKWDRKIAPIANAVARLRGLEFLHPVPIRYLSDKGFEKELGSAGPIGADDRAEAEREEAVFRAMGFIDGKVDLLSAFGASQSSGTLAYYDEGAQEIVVRGTKLDVAHRVTLAHELTHVLQDQHFDLTMLHKRAFASDTGDPSAFKALVEGDAVRIQQAYLKQLSAADQKAFERENDAEGDRVKQATTSVPDIVDLLGSAPYAFGKSTVGVLSAEGGNDAVNDALTGPTPSSSVFVEAGLVEPSTAVDAPLPSADAVAVGRPEPFGAFEMFTMLSTRLDPGRALLAADVVGGGKAVTFRSNGIICYRVVVDPVAEHSRAFLLAAVQDWAHGRSRTSVDAVGDLVGFTACDPGTEAPEPSAARFKSAVRLLSIRMELTLDAARDHVSGDLARCFARVFVATPDAEKLVLEIGNGKPTAQQNLVLRRDSAASAILCRDDPDTALP
jgi:hypothetical protein